MAWIDDLPNPNLPYNRINGEKYFYTSSNGQTNIRYIMTWFRMRFPGCKFKAMAAICGCMNGESAINPATIYGFNNYQYLFENRKRAFGLCQFIPGCLPTDHDENYYQNYHGTNKPILYYYMKNHNLGSDINILYTNTGYATDMRVQLQYISDMNGWKRTTSTSYDPVYGKSYTGTISDFMNDTQYDTGHMTAWFYAAFIRSGSPSVALPRYINHANAIYDLFQSEFGDDTPVPPKPPAQYKSFIIIAKGAGLF